ncbi:outer membrane protein OmpA-like peptidoglycan-associated protein [Wenyingzhuangia heitensis]|uniref:Outer membrane protein OmpA-like peptidoglycan-associated protein n=1 Tax=Wenyingzhuangia heitensis TaxID=1487859 RepID=A0ABX0UDK7_9FLAO|nr:hypothetical protein [Wenyingzhuangia heitensis]NIJ45137.1 outer membrane protein OmpA-like peptidoglycan-associated protein [Wenyingzhuangia heitensis]
MKKSSYFWVGYSDLMTSMFFLMLVLYVVTFTQLKTEIQKLIVTQTMVDKIKEIQNALNSLDEKYFEFDKESKRYKLKIDASFRPGSKNIFDIPTDKREELFDAGNELYNKLESIIKQNKNVDYLLIIEGNTARYQNNYLENPDRGYELSYQRALALNNFWKSKGIDFIKLAPQCEIILAGSGYFGQSRDNIIESNNKRFTIQITSKIGKLIEND